MNVDGRELKPLEPVVRKPAAASPFDDRLIKAGMTGEEIIQFKQDLRTELSEAGFTQKEIDDVMGVKAPQMKSAKAMLEKNIDKNRPAPEESSGEPGQIKAPETADSFLDAFEAGFDISVTGLALDRPDMALKNNPGLAYSLISQLGTMAGDLPAMLVGGVAGGLGGAAAGAAAGSAIPVAGTAAGAAVGGVVGVGAGSFALPEAIREAYIRSYEDGDIEDWGDFWDRTTAVFYAGLKGAVIGGATAGVGAGIGRLAAGQIAGRTLPAAVQTGAQLTSEIGTMVSVGAALEGEAPRFEDFTHAAILVGALRGTGIAVSKTSPALAKMRDVYVRSGIKPLQIAENATGLVAQKLKSVTATSEQVIEVMTGKKFPKKEIPEDALPSTRLKPKEPKGEVSEVTQEALSRFGEPAPEPKAPLSQRTKEALNKFYEDYVDKLDPVKRMVDELNALGDKVPVSRNAYKLARMANDFKAKAKVFFERETFSATTLEKTGKSLTSILEGVENVEVLSAYTLAQRTIQKAKEGIDTGFLPLEKAKALVKEHKAKYDKAAKEVTEYSNRVLDYAVEAEVLSPAQATKWKEAAYYLPMNRVFDAAEVKPGGKGKTPGSFKKLKGSERQVLNPIIQLMENTVEILRLSEANKATKALVEQAQAVQFEGLKRVAPKKKIKVTADEIKKALADQGFEDAPIEGFSIYRAAQKHLLENEFAVMEKGKLKVYQTEDAAVARALKSLTGSPAAAGLFIKLAQGTTRIKKLGITTTPDFIMRNAMRDTMTAMVFAKEGLIRPDQLLLAMGDILFKTDTYYQWNKSGGAQGAFLEFTDRYATSKVMKIQEQTNFLGSAKNVVRTGADVFRLMATLAEQTPRLAEYKRVSQRVGDIEGRIIGRLEGGFSSREITLDFQRSGAKAQALNAIIAFLNVGIQGVDRTARAVKEQPAKTLTTSLGLLTAPTLLLWQAQHNDPRYQEIPTWQKVFFWNIVTDDWQDAAPGEDMGLPEYLVRTENGKVQINKGVIWRIPKPMELGLVFASLPEFMANAFYHEDKTSVSDVLALGVESFMPSVVPDILTAPIEQYINQSFFTGSDIVPMHLEGVDPQEQYTEALIKSGAVPDPVRPTMTLEETPFLRSFLVRYPTGRLQSVEQFWDRFKRLDQFEKTFKLKTKNLEADKAIALMDDPRAELFFAVGPVMKSTKQSISDAQALVRSIYRNPDYSPDEKRQIIDSQYFMMAEMAKMANELYLETKRQLDGDQKTRREK